MASLEQVARDLKGEVLAALAPYQPSIPPNYINLDTRAGTIFPTLVTTGEPQQYYVLERLENNSCQVAIYFADNQGGSEQNNINMGTATKMLPIVAGQTTYWLEVGRATKQFNVDVWAFDKDSRDAIGEVLRQRWGDYFRLTCPTDATIELFRMSPPEDLDQEQLDSVYVRRFKIICDYTITRSYDASTVVTATVNEKLPDGSTISKSVP